MEANFPTPLQVPDRRTQRKFAIIISSLLLVALLALLAFVSLLPQEIRALSDTLMLAKSSEYIKIRFMLNDVVTLLATLIAGFLLVTFHGKRLEKKAPILFQQSQFKEANQCKEHFETLQKHGILAVVLAAVLFMFVSKAISGRKMIQIAEATNSELENMLEAEITKTYSKGAAVKDENSATTAVIKKFGIWLTSAPFVEMSCQRRLYSVCFSGAIGISRLVDNKTLSSVVGDKTLSFVVGDKSVAADLVSLAKAKLESGCLQAKNGVACLYFSEGFSGKTWDFSSSLDPIPARLERIKKAKAVLKGVCPQENCGTTKMVVRREKMYASVLPMIQSCVSDNFSICGEIPKTLRNEYQDEGAREFLEYLKSECKKGKQQLCSVSESKNVMPAAASGASSGTAVPGVAEKDLSEEALNSACEKKDGNACAILASRIFDTKFPPAKRDEQVMNEFATKIFPRMIELAKKGCELDSAMGCSLIGLVWLKGYSSVEPIVDNGEFRSTGTRDDKLARIYFEKACKLSAIPGCFHLATLLIAGRGGKMENQRGLELFSRVCASKSATESGPACDQLPKSMIYEIECNSGRLEFCVHAGYGFYTGQGMERDLKRARALYQKGCAAPGDLACISLAEMMRDGEGGPKDAPRAQEIFKAGCEAKSPWGCQHMAILLQKDKKENGNVAKIASLFKIGCEKAHYSCFKLAEMWKKGSLGTKDEIKAREFEVRGKCLEDKNENCPAIPR
jgi:TPR repeat protein